MKGNLEVPRETSDFASKPDRPASRRVLSWRKLSACRVETHLDAWPARALLLCALISFPVRAQAPPPTPLTGAAELAQTLDQLNTLGSLLMLGAHPDDENTAVIAYFARGRHMRTAYLSATRGEGGQNLIGAEQAELMGLIRTQELLAARRIDGGEQFFTRAIDFGFSKSPEEALEKWGREQVLSDMVRVIRRFRPDVIVSRFSPLLSSGHGQHTAVGKLSSVAFEAAGDPSRFPDQIQRGLRPWKAKRLYWNTLTFTRRMIEAESARKDRLRINVGQYDPVLGKSYAEIAGESRSLHRSQAMGTSQRKGNTPAFFAHIAGETAEKDLFEGIDTSWGRVPGAAAVSRLLTKAREAYRPDRPEAILPLLIDAYSALKDLDGYWPEVKRPQLLKAIELAAGLWIDAAADRWDATPGNDVNLSLSVVNRSQHPFTWTRTEVAGVAAGSNLETAGLAFNEAAGKQVSLRIPEFALYSEPEWLRRSSSGALYNIHDPRVIGMPQAPPVLEATFYLRTSKSVELPFRRPVIYRWVDHARGERSRSLQIVPGVAVSFAQLNMIFPSSAERDVSVRLQSNVPDASGSATLEVPQGWRVSPASAPFAIKRSGQQITLRFELTPPANPSGGEVVAKVEFGGKSISNGMQEISYPHIPIQMSYPKARMRVERADVQLLSKGIGYIMGAGDKVPAALEQLGATVSLLSEGELVSADLSQFDAVVTGVRAVNTRQDLRAARQRLLEYVEAGGTLVVQYNTLSRRSRTQAVLGPYPLTLSRDRVSVEEAPVTFPSPDHPLLQAPNRITERDFEGWVQERGLYFMSEWDERYQPVLQCNDPGEPPRLGGMLYARYGKGVYIFTGYSWFRQLPAGVPGAYRIFANLVSAGKVR